MILSTDSMQVYRGMDIGTAKPSEADQARVPHFMIDLVDPSEDFSVAEFQALGREVLDSPLRSARAGDGRFGTPSSSAARPDGIPAPRSRPPSLGNRRHGARRGPGRLRGGGPRTPARSWISPTRAGSSRALEVVRSHRNDTIVPRHRPPSTGRCRSYEPFVPFVARGVDAGPALAARISRRIATMLESGLVDEVAGLDRPAWARPPRRRWATRSSYPTCEASALWPPRDDLIRSTLGAGQATTDLLPERPSRALAGRGTRIRTCGSPGCGPVSIGWGDGLREDARSGQRLRGRGRSLVGVGRGDLGVVRSADGHRGGRSLGGHAPRAGPCAYGVLERRRQARQKCAGTGSDVSPATPSIAVGRGPDTFQVETAVGNLSVEMLDDVTARVEVGRWAVDLRSRDRRESPVSAGERRQSPRGDVRRFGRRSPGRGAWRR